MRVVLRHCLLLKLPIAIFLFLMPSPSPASEHPVPLGTRGNQIFLTIENPTPFPLQHARAIITSCPEWISFDPMSVPIDSIPIGGHTEVEFDFDVSSGEAGKTGAVRISVTGPDGRLVSSRVVMMRTIIPANPVALEPPYPNPLNPSTVIRFTMREPGHVKIGVCDILGKTVRAIIDGSRPAGRWDLVWDGRDQAGYPVSSGIYLVRLETLINGKSNNCTMKVTVCK
jgi:hypothetical protein